MFLFDVINLALLGVAAIYVSFALFIIKRGRDTKVALSYLLVITSVIAWTLSAFFYRGADETGALFWARLLYSAATLVASSFYFFSLAMPDRGSISRQKILIVAALNLAAIILALYPGAFIRRVVMVPGQEKTILWGPLYVLYFLYHGGLFTLGLANLFTNYHREKGIVKLQLRYVFWGYFLGSILALDTNLIMPWIGMFQLNWAGQVLSVFMVAFTAYAIIRHRLMGIRLIGSKLFTYLLISVFAYAFFYFILLIDEGLLGGIYSPEALVLAPLFALFFAVLFVPFFKKVQKSSDIIFYSGYNPRSIIKNLGLKLGSTMDRDELLKILSFEFRKILATGQVEVFLFEDKKDKSGGGAISLNKPAKKLESDNPICGAIWRHKKVIVREEADQPGRRELGREMDKLKAKIIAPLALRNDVIGFIAIGEKVSQDAYTVEDFEFLEILRSQAAVAVENATLYQKIEDFNRTLKQKVEAQTRDIKEKTDRLKKLVEMRSDFLDITSHQLRTPVSVIKGVLSMLDEGSIPKEKIKDFVKGALDKAIILSEIINDILRASEMDSDKFELRPRPLHLEPLLGRIKDDKAKLAAIKDIELRLALPAEPLPQIMSDEKYLEQAIGNLLDNAFQYTMSGGSVKMSAEYKNDRVIVRVADSGIGIPQVDIPKLFHKFGRGDNALSTYADGSGLGLYIVRKIMDAHPGGKAEIEKTVVGKGTTFALSFPALISYTEKALSKSVARSKV